jgi:hypothetical protein
LEAQVVRREVVQIVQRMLRRAQKMLCFMVLEGAGFD